MKKKNTLAMLLAILILVVFIGCTPKDKEAATQKKYGSQSFFPDTKPKNVVADYKIVEIDDTSIGGAKRFGLQVVTKTLDKEEIKQVGISAIEQFKRKTEFNAVMVFIYHHEGFIGDGYTLGRVIYAPWGDFARSMEVRTGDYSNMQFQFDIRETNPEYQLTDFETDIILQWNNVYDTLMDEWFETHDNLMDADLSNMPDDQTATDLVAKQNNLTSEQVDSIQQKYMNFLYK
jgi:hypothetical protein